MLGRADESGPSGLMVTLCLQCRLHLSWVTPPNVFLKADAVLLQRAVLCLLPAPKILWHFTSHMSAAPALLLGDCRKARVKSWLQRMTEGLIHSKLVRFHTGRSSFLCGVGLCISGALRCVGGIKLFNLSDESNKGCGLFSFTWFWWGLILSLQALLNRTLGSTRELCSPERACAVAASGTELACGAEPRAGSSPLVLWRDATATDGPEHPGMRVSAGGRAAPGPPAGDAPAGAAGELPPGSWLCLAFVCAEAPWRGRGVLRSG